MSTRTLAVSVELLTSILQVFKGGPPRMLDVVANPLPDDARCVGAVPDPYRQCVVLEIASSEFTFDQPAELPSPIVRMTIQPPPLAPEDAPLLKILDERAPTVQFREFF